MLSKEEFKDMQESTSGEFFGIGIEITMENNQLTVVTPIEDTPADKGGMKSGDIILAVGGKPTLEMTLQEAVSHIRGPKGSEVVLTILHRDSKEPVDLRIKRDAIPLISVKSRELEPGYYWVRLTRFQRTHHAGAARRPVRRQAQGPHQGHHPRPAQQPRRAAGSGRQRLRRVPEQGRHRLHARPPGRNRPRIRRQAARYRHHRHPPSSCS